MSQSVLQPKILILSQKPAESIFLTKICSHIGTVYTATVIVILLSNTTDDLQTCIKNKDWISFVFIVFMILLTSILWLPIGLAHWYANQVRK